MHVLMLTEGRYYKSIQFSPYVYTKKMWSRPPAGQMRMGESFLEYATLPYSFLAAQYTETKQMCTSFYQEKRAFNDNKRSFGNFSFFEGGFMLPVYKQS